MNSIFIQMKKLIFVMLFIGLATFTYGQYVPKGKTAKAEMALSQGKLDIAKAEIDEAFKIDEKGKISTASKNWYTKGQIYKAIYLDSGEFKSLVPGDEALKIAMESFNKVKEMDKETSTYVIFSEQETTQLYGFIVNQGAEKYNENDFEGAYKEFKTALMVVPNDTTALLYGGVSAQQADMLDEALECFQTLADHGDANIDTYKTLIYMYRTEKEDNDMVLSTINSALKKYPDNKDFTQEKITTLIIMERVDEAKSELEEAIENEPTNPQYYYFLGYLFDSQDEVEPAIENYQKAIELNPDYYEANYNLGVMHYNKARDVVSELNNLPLNEYRKMEAAYEEKAHVHFNEALPYFEKAAEVKPNEDIQLLETLEGVYLQLHMTDKAKALEERIKALSGQ